MARSTPTVDHGTILGPAGVREAVWAKIIEKLTSIQSAGVQAWEADDVVSDVPGNRQIVYHSVGDRSLVAGAGDADIWALVTMPAAGSYRVYMYQDWSNTSHTGHRQVGYTGGYAMALNDASNCEWWFVGNEYEFVMVFAQAGTYQYLSFGQVIRPFSTRLAGICRNTGAIAAAPGAQTIGVDRDMTGQLQVGQRVWLLNQTPGGVALQTPGVDLVTVSAINPAAPALALTLTGITQAYAIGSLIGLDPQPAYVQPGQSSSTPLNASNQYMVQKGDGTWAATGGQLAGSLHTGLQVTEADADPGPDNLYPGYQAFLRMSAAPAIYRGKLQHIRAFSLGLQADGDIMRIDYDATNQWWVFPAFVTSAWVPAIGPGAT